MPCFIHEWNKVRQVTLLGTGISDWTDPVLPEAAVPLIKGHFNDSKDWDVISWQDLSANHPLHHAFVSAPDTPCSEIKLAGAFDEYWNARSKDLRRNLRRYSQKAEQQGDVVFSITKQPEETLLDDLVRLHELRWKKQDQPGMITANSSEAFLRDAAKHFAQSGLLRLYHISFKNQTAAISMGFLYQNRIYSYLSAFDPQFEILGFGRTLLYNAIKDAFANGYTTWNFLRGEEEYKLSWGAEFIPKIRLYSAK